MEEAFILLDDCNATEQLPTSRLYLDFAGEYVVQDSCDLEDAWKKVDDAISRGLSAAFLIEYEWGAKLMGLHAAHALPRNDSACLRIMLFRRMVRLSAQQVADHLHLLEGGREVGPAGVSEIVHSVTRDEYATRVREVLDYIRAGETYQINFTYRLTGIAYGSPVALYRRLRSRQPVEFGALVRLPASSGTQWVLSCSPELFVAHERGTMTARPMKGTAPRSSDPHDDRASAEWLRADSKNRAENVMIVDLLRNDLGRISEVGSVRVPKLFSVESYQTVHQMTSTVSSELLPETSFPQVLRALFPCGSITGAPKHHAMELIARLESTPRGLYTGAIGWIDSPADKRACGDFCMSVAIRTLTLGPASEGRRQASLGVGGGIVVDSTAEDEFEESLLKARFLTTLDPGLTLFETMRSRGQSVLGLDRHLLRIEASARALGFRFEATQCRRAITDHAQYLSPAGQHRIRLDLRHDGTTSVRSVAITTGPARVKVLIAEGYLPPLERALVRHKTSFRSSYDVAIKRAEAAGAFDTIFFNDQDELTEGARTNVFVRLSGRWWTPPIACGLLPGTMRARLLTKQNLCGERVITRDDFARSEALVVCSALSGVLHAEVLRD